MANKERSEEDISPREVSSKILEIQCWLSSDEVHFGNKPEDRMMRKAWADRQRNLQEQLRQMEDR